MADINKKGLKKYSLAEIKKHNSQISCWIIIENKVYDVTQFLKDHPGGKQILLKWAGKNGTIDFKSIGHSIGAIEKRQSLLIGQVKAQASQSILFLVEIVAFVGLTIYSLRSK